MSETKKCSWCGKRKKVNSIYRLGKNPKDNKNYNICTDCNIEKEIV